MRRIVNGLGAYLAELRDSTTRGWNAFFFTPADPTPLGLIRIIVGLLALWSMFVYGLDLQDFLGSTGWADPAAVGFVQGSQAPFAWSFWTVVPDSWLRPVWLVCLVVFGLFTLGLWSRTTAFLAWVIVVSTSRRVPVALYGFDQALSTWLLYLAATGASGQAISLDRFFKRWRQTRSDWASRRGDGSVPASSGVPEPTISANLALRLFQLHLCLIYGMAGLAKLQGPAWWTGMAIWGTVAAGEFQTFDVTWLVVYPWMMHALTHWALGLELLYPALVWVRPLRPLVLLSVAALHIGIGVIVGLNEFGIAMIAGNLAFVSGFRLRSLVTGKEPSKPAGKVLYDGACPRCRASMALITALDPARMIEPVDLTAVNVASIHPSLTREKCMEAMHLVRADGRVSAGYDALVAVGRWLPMLSLPSVLGSSPGVRAIGRRVYRKIADSRPRDVPCTDDVCGIHPKPRTEKPAPTERV